MRLIDGMTDYGIVTEHKTYINGHAAYLTTILLSEFGKPFVIKLHQDLANYNIAKVWEKIFRTHKLYDVLDSSLFGGLFVLDINTTEEMLLYLIAILDFQGKNNLQANLSDVFVHIFPKGMVDSITAAKVVNTLIIPRILTHSYLYYTMGLEFVTFENIPVGMM